MKPIRDRSGTIGIQHLKEYIGAFGNASVKFSYVSPDGFNLGIWLFSQIIKYREGKLPPERVSMLYDAGYDLELYTKPVLDIKWDVGIQHLKEFIDTFGNVAVKHNYVSPDGFKLGIWLRTRKKLINEGKVSPEKISMLYETGYSFHRFTKPAWLLNWESGYDHLIEYVESFGNAMVPSGHYLSPDGFKLGNWVLKKRNHYQSLPLWQIKALEALGFKWETRK